MGTIGQLVYVVDDEEIIARSLAMILNREGFIAIPFVDPLAALATAENQPPDLLITDIKMPAMTGIELGTRFRRLYPQCRVLLFSGTSPTTELLHNPRDEGHRFEHLTKPVHPADLLAKLREVLPATQKEPSSKKPDDGRARSERRA